MIKTPPTPPTNSPEQQARLLAQSILTALHLQAEHRRTSFGLKGRRALLQEKIVEAFQQAYNISNQLKPLLPTTPRSRPHRLAASLRSALHQYQGAYWGWKQAQTEENRIELDTATQALRRTAIKVKNSNTS